MSDSLFKKVLVVLSGNLVSAGVSFVLMYGAAKVLSPYYFGRFSLVFTGLAISEIILNMGAASALIGYVNRIGQKNSDTRRLNLSSFSLILSLSLCSFLIFLVFIFSEFIPFSLYDLCLILILGVSLSLYSNFVAIAQSKQMWGLQNALIILNSCARVSFVFAAFVYARYMSFDEDLVFQSILNSLFAYSVLLLLVALVFLWKRELGKFSLSIIEIRNSFRYMAPIATSNLVIVLFMRTDGLLIVYFLGVSEFAKYSAANILGMAIPLITRSLMNVSFSIASIQTSGYIETIWRRQLNLLPWIVLISCILFLMSNFVIDALYGDKYVGIDLVFFILSLGYLWGIYFVPLESYFYVDSPNKILKYKFSGLVSLSILAPPLLLQMGITGGAFALLLAKIISWGFLMSDVFKCRKEQELYNSKGQA